MNLRMQPAVFWLFYKQNQRERERKCLCLYADLFRQTKQMCCPCGCFPYRELLFFVSVTLPNIEIQGVRYVACNEQPLLLIVSSSQTFCRKKKKTLPFLLGRIYIHLHLQYMKTTNLFSQNDLFDKNDKIRKSVRKNHKIYNNSH